MSQQPNPPLSFSENHPQPAINSNAKISLTFGAAGLALGVISLLAACSLPIVTALGAWGALYFGYKAKREISASNGSMSGNGMTTAGIILGWINGGIAIISTIFFIWLLAVLILNVGSIHLE